MFTAKHNGKDYKYFEIGDEVEQGYYPGAPATILEVLPQGDNGHNYKIRIDLREIEDDGFDENGEKKDSELATTNQDALNHWNP